jgi:hypothetical protein
MVVRPTNFLTIIEADGYIDAVGGLRANENQNDPYVEQHMQFFEM